MEYCKFIFIFIILFLGTVGQRFHRHLLNETQNEFDLGKFDLSNSDKIASDGSYHLGELLSGGDSFDINTVSDVPLEYELLHDELKFQMCTYNCDDNEVILCFDSDEPNTVQRSNQCGPNQCTFQAGFMKDRTSKIRAKYFTTVSNDAVTQQCDSVTMQYPTTQYFDLQGSSCYPKKYDGNVVKIYVKEASTECFAKIIGARKWIPPTSTPAIISSTPKTDDSMKAETIWIIVGVVLVAVVIALACSGFWGCRYWKQRKSAAKSDGKTKQTLPDKKVIEIPVKQEIAIEEKVEKAQTTKDETAEKIQPKLKMAGHEVKDNGHPIIAKTSKKKTVEPTQEETPSGKTVEPTVEDTTHPSIVQNHGPTVTVLKEPIHPPRPYGLAPRSRSYSKSRKTDSLSGRHDLNIQYMVETPLQTLERCKPSAVNDEMKKFYPAEDKPRGRDLREIVILYCRISAMFRMIEELIGAAEKKLKKRGVKFDGNALITELPQKAFGYLMSESCHEFVRSFAFGNLFREQIDSALGNETTSSIPLLFVIILQRRYPVQNRRKACAWIRRQLPILRIEFSIHERMKLPYPLNTIEKACQLDVNGFTNTTNLCTLSNDENDAQKNQKIDGRMKKSKTKK